MVREVDIFDRKTGEKLREDYVPVGFTIFGCSIPDLIKIGGALLAIVVFFVNGQADKKNMQEAITTNAHNISRLIDFKDNTDSWNTYAYGTRFVDGQPLDKTYRVETNKGIVNH